MNRKVIQGLIDRLNKDYERQLLYVETVRAMTKLDDGEIAAGLEEVRKIESLEERNNALLDEIRELQKILLEN